MTWAELDWAILERLRQRFLGDAANGGPYWETPADLANYDLTYGERIGWKWDQVLRELRLRGWVPAPGSTLLDWGCGSGVAARRVIEFFGATHFDSLLVWDHSPLACDYAAAAAERTFPGLRVAQAMPGFMASESPIGLLVVSHVLNELPADALVALRRVVERAEAVLWVEPGTHAVSRQLGALRDEFLGRFHVVAPCPHGQRCPVLTAGHERDWCHFFAPTPAAVFADSDWVKFGHRAGIDLRSLPYCFVALDRRPTGAAPDGLARVIGRVETFKPYARVLSCEAGQLAKLELPKRADPALFKQLERSKAPLVYRWRHAEGKIQSGEPLA